jgi:hypothetical protein
MSEPKTTPAPGDPGAEHMEKLRDTFDWRCALHLMHQTERVPDTYPPELVKAMQQLAAVVSSVAAAADTRRIADSIERQEDQVTIAVSRLMAVVTQANRIFVGIANSLEAIALAMHAGRQS